MTKILTIFLVLTLSASTSYSQDTTIEITTEQAKEAVRNAQRVQSLMLEVATYKQRILGFEDIEEQLQQSVSNLNTRLELSQRNYETMKNLYEAEKERKNPSYNFNDFLFDAGKVLVGAVLGILAISL